MSRASKVEPPVESVAQGRYVLEGILGVGGMATVYRAHDVRLDLPRAVKILNSELVSSASLRKRFEMEARTMAKLHHPNIVSVIDIGVENEFAFMVMELLDGGSLNDRLKNVGYLLPRTALAAVQSILSALILAHGRGVIHRDIKPHNVLVTLDGVPKLTDFGIAHLIGQDRALTASNAVIGTWAFMAPEQRKSARRVTVQTDIYAVGATLYALLTARDPFDIYNKELQKEMFAGIPDPLVEVIERATRYWPEERYTSAADMLAAVTRADNLLRPDYLDEPSKLTPLLDLSGPATGVMPVKGRTDPGESPFDADALGATFDSAMLDNEAEIRTAPNAVDPRSTSNPTLAAPSEEEGEDETDPRVRDTDPFEDEATPIHLWQASTDPSVRRLVQHPGVWPPERGPIMEDGPTQPPPGAAPPAAGASAAALPVPATVSPNRWLVLALGGLVLAIGAWIATMIMNPPLELALPDEATPPSKVEVEGPPTGEAHRVKPAEPAEPAEPAASAEAKPQEAPSVATPPTPAPEPTPAERPPAAQPQGARTGSPRVRPAPPSAAEQRRRLEALPGQ